jgi:cell growth-regulating nucleolar protein
LLSHAEGKKHRAKARAFHAKNQPNGVTQEAGGVPVLQTSETNIVNGQNHSNGDLKGEEKSVKRKREKQKTDEQNGRVAGVENVEPKIEKKKKVKGAKEDGDSEIKWKKIITSILKSVTPSPNSPIPPIQGNRNQSSQFSFNQMSTINN